MKKLIVCLQIFVALLFVMKIAALGEIAQKSVPAPPGPPQQAQAETSPPLKGPIAVKEGDDGLSKSRTLLKSLDAKKEELDKREQLLKSEEQRLLSLKKEILEKIDSLNAHEEKLAAVIDANKTAEGKRYKDLAKVFEATPAAKAGVMLEQLDVQTAAGITMNMKRDKAGAIWGYLTPQRAVEITREITRTGKRNSE